MERTLAQPLAAAPGSTDVDERFEGTGLIFFGLILMLLFEFTGVDRLVPPLRAIRFSTLLGYALFLSILLRTGSRAFSTRQGQLLALFVAMNFLTIPLAVVQTYAFTAFRTHLDYFGLFVVTCYVVDRPARVRQFAIVASLIAVTMVARNFERLIIGDRHAAGGFDGGVFVSNGNDFAWGLNVLLPFAVMLVVTRQRIVWRALGLAAILAAVFGIIGTQSRGATIALAASVLFYWAYVMKRKALGVAVVVAGVVTVFMFAPAAYFERMNTIQNYQSDNSAMSRFQLWGAAIKMSMDYPLGVGGENFASAYGRYYIPEDDKALRTWAQGKWLSAHSVYFRLLGEYGVLGVIWFLVLLRTNWNHNWISYSRLRQQPSRDGTPPEWPLLLNMSLIGYAISGIFLGGLTYPHFHLLSGLTAGAWRQGLWHTQSVESSDAAPQTPRPAPVMSVTERAKQMMQARRPVS